MLSDRLKTAMQAANVSQAELARACGVKPPSVHGWLSGKSKFLRGENLLTAAKALNVSQSWLATGKGSMQPKPGEEALPPTAPMLTAGAAPPPEQYIRLPVLGRAAAGTGQEALGEHIATMDVFIPWFRRVYGRSPAGVSLLTAKGGSMSGVIEDGDVMFVVPVQEFADDGIYIVAIGDLLRVKRLKLRIDGTLAIESTDGSAPELMPLAQVGDTLRIQGRVIGSLGVRKHG